MPKREYTETQLEVRNSLKTLEAAVIDMQADAEIYPNYAAAKEIMYLHDEKTIEEIRRQAPSATCVMSKEQWKQEFHRQIRPKAQAIKITRTNWQEETSEQEKRDSAGNPILGADGQPVRASVTQKVQKEVLVPLYDVSQTRGEAFPPSIQNVHSYPVKDYEEVVRALQETFGQPIRIDDVRNKLNLEKPLRPNGNVAQRLAVFETLSKLTHSNVLWHHRVDANYAVLVRGAITPQIAKIASEAAAYAICKHLGVEAIDFATPTLAETCNKRAVELKISRSMIYATSFDFIEEIDAKLAEIHSEKGLSAGQKMVQRQGNAPEQAKVSIEEQLAAAQAKAEQNRSADTANPVKHDKAKGDEKDRIKTQQKFRSSFHTLHDEVLNIQKDAKMYPNYAAAKKIVHLYDEKTVEEIRRQAPIATCVMSKEQWEKEFHRQILPGAQAIKITRTNWQEETSEREKRDSAGNPILGADGQPARAGVTRTVQKERLVPLYDVLQTRGEPFPASIQNLRPYQVKDYEEVTKVLQEVSEHPIENAAGYMPRKRMLMSSNLTPRLAAFDTLTKVACLQMLRHSIGATHERPAAARFNKEMMTIASKAVAYITCKHLGVEAMDLAAPAIAEVCGEQAPELETGFDVIHACSSDLIREIDARLAKMHSEKGLSAGQKMVQRQGNAPEQTKVSIEEQLAAAQAKAEQNRGSDAENPAKHDKAEER